MFRLKESVSVRLPDHKSLVRRGEGIDPQLTSTLINAFVPVVTALQKGATCLVSAG
jgi:hypothetical protein